MIRPVYTKPTIEEAFQLAEAQARLREHNAQLHRDYIARKRAEREAVRDARAQAKAQALAVTREKREAARRLRDVVKEQDRHEKEELRQAARRLRESERALRGGKGVSMRFTLEQCAQLEALAAAYNISQSEVIRRALDAVYANMKNKNLA